jgi:hypothetical protein
MLFLFVLFFYCYLSGISNLIIDDLKIYSWVLWLITMNINFFISPNKTFVLLGGWFLIYFAVMLFEYFS